MSTTTTTDLKTTPQMSAAPVTSVVPSSGPTEAPALPTEAKKQNLMAVTEVKTVPLSESAKAEPAPSVLLPCVGMLPPTPRPPTHF